MSARHLLSIRRVITSEMRSPCDEGWARLAEAAQAAGANAWRFRSLTEADLHLEFLEFKGSRDPRQDAAVATALQALARLSAPSAIEEWIGG